MKHGIHHAILSELANFAIPPTLPQLNAALFNWPAQEVAEAVDEMVRAGWITEFSCCAHLHLNITPRGRELLEAEAGEAPAEAVASHRDGTDEDREPAAALLCVDEDELDGWWDALDVEAKADAFAQWSLGNDGRNSHIYIEPSKPGIPVDGTIEDEMHREPRCACHDAVSQPDGEAGKAHGHRGGR